jgi:hypothetical protein
LKAPNATNAFRIGKYGNFSIAGTALNDNILGLMSKLDYDSTIQVIGFSPVLGNTNVGSAGTIIRALNMTLTATCTTAAADTTNTIEGSRLTAVAGQSSGGTANDRFRGSIYGHRITSYIVGCATIGTPVVTITDFQGPSACTITRYAVADRCGFEHQGNINLLTSAALTDHHGFRCKALGGGTNRIGFECKGFAGGTIAYGFRSLLHSGGTTRRSFYGDNSFICTANDYLCDTAAKGLIVKDAQGSPVYWRYTVAADGTPAVVNAGTTLPTT